MTRNSGLIRTTMVCILLTIFVLLLIYAQQILIPLTWALLFAFVLFPVSEFLEKKGMGRTWSSVLVTVLFTIISGVILFYLVYQAVRILQQEGSMLRDVQLGFENVSQYLKDTFGISLKEGEGATFDLAGRALNFVAGEISQIGKNIVTITLIPMFLFFLLLYRDIAHQFTEARYDGSRLQRINLFFGEMRSSIQNYLVGTLILTGVTSLMALIILLLFGIKYAFFFSIFIAILNLIPYIGNLAAFVVVLFFVWVTKQDPYSVLFVGLALYAANLVQENFLRPKLVGDKMEMNAMVVFTAVIVGGMIWGFSGMVLFIPMMGMLKALFDSNPKWNAYSIFFESGKQKTSDTDPPQGDAQVNGNKQ